MNLFVIGLTFLSSISVFAYEDLKCNLSLLRNAKQVAQTTVVQNTSGVTISNVEGDGFYKESIKKRFLRKPKVMSQISFAMYLDTGTNTGTFYFNRQTEPNKYGIFTKFEKLGEPVVATTNGEQVSSLNEEYSVKSSCIVVPRGY